MSDKNKSGEDRKIELSITNRQIVKSQFSFAKLCNLPFSSARLRYWISKTYKKFEKTLEDISKIEGEIRQEFYQYDKNTNKILWEDEENQIPKMIKGKKQDDCNDKFNELYDTEETIEVYKVYLSEIESYEEELTEEQKKDNKFLLTSQDMSHLEEFIDWEK